MYNFSPPREDSYLDLRLFTSQIDDTVTEDNILFDILVGDHFIVVDVEPVGLSHIKVKYMKLPSKEVFTMYVNDIDDDDLEKLIARKKQDDKRRGKDIHSVSFNDLQGVL